MVKMTLEDYLPKFVGTATAGVTGTLLTYLSLSSSMPVCCAGTAALTAGLAMAYLYTEL